MSDIYIAICRANAISACFLVLESKSQDRMPNAFAVEYFIKSQVKLPLNKTDYTIQLQLTSEYFDQAAYYIPQIDTSFLFFIDARGLF